MFDINMVVLEGPDLSGKTTLYNQIHAESNYRWNIQDRSTLSMICYARQFNRDTTKLRRALTRELTNLNNRMLVLLPSWNVLEDRYHTRGDEIQTLSSLRSLYEIFLDEVSKIKGLPNVSILSETSDETAKAVVRMLSRTEDKSTLEVGSDISEFVVNYHTNEERLDMSFTGLMSDKYDDEILSDPLEGDYYKEILWDFENVIRKERRGINPYHLPQGLDSRRFYYNSDSCMSSIHFMPRGETLKCHVVFRSTNAVKNAGIDLTFVNYLVHKLGNKYFSSCENYELDVRMNSAHLIAR